MTLISLGRLTFQLNDMSEQNTHQNAEAQAAQENIAQNNENSQTANEVSDHEQTQAQMQELQAKVAELQDQFLRSVADVQNARRRADEEIAKARKFAVEAFAESMLPVCDSLEAGLAIKEASIEQIREGADATLRQLKSALERNKVIAIDPAVASKFDPNLHQAISMVPADQEANTIVSVLQKGYTIADRVLRPALVMVAAPK